MLEDTRDPLATQVQYFVLFYFVLNSLNQRMDAFQLFSVFVSCKKKHKDRFMSKEKNYALLLLNLF